MQVILGAPLPRSTIYLLVAKLVSAPLRELMLAGTLARMKESLPDCLIGSLFPNSDEALR